MVKEVRLIPYSDVTWLLLTGMMLLSVMAVGAFAQDVTQHPG